MKKVFFLSLLFYSFIGMSHTTPLIFSVKYINYQEDQKINQKDEKGKKQGKWIFFGRDQPQKGFPENGKIAEGNFKDDRKEGNWVMYYKDGYTPKVKGYYLNNRPNGEFIKYHTNGKIKAEGEYNTKFYTGTLKEYNEKGILIHSGNYNENGQEEGEIKYFYDNGQPEFIYTAKEGKPFGKATRYWPNGDVKEEIIFNNDGSVQKTSGEIAKVNREVIVEKVGKTNTKTPPSPKNTQSDFNPNSYNKLYNSNLELWMDGEFKDGKLYDGRLYIYDKDGLLEKVEVYKNGKYHSDGQI